MVSKTTKEKMNLERFFERINDKPSPNEYGHDERLDCDVIKYSRIPTDGKFNGYAENKLSHIKKNFVRKF